VVSFDSRDAALKDMGYFLSADITKFDPGYAQLERAGWLVYDPDNVSNLSLEPVAVHGAGNVIYVHIHPLIPVPLSPISGDPHAVEDNAANRIFSPGDRSAFSTASRLIRSPLQAAVIGSDGSISYAAGGDKPDDYRDKSVTLVAPKGTIPLLDPNH
jgi:hypothetical protein